eukprot:TRINITY_DN16151_c1_g1_i1.p1 TRINITY_DN16151_c1_g1~~TRINITY_DN16151_c1_g1_i1.p1  ORF type:complete len:146 (-),score=34.59 TRINITY_DN16151_c1_g1_i1:78-515(-)
MTFSMSELNKTSTKIIIDEEEEEEVGMSAKELEEAKKAAKELQARNDDIALLVCMIVILIITCLVVVIKVNFIDEVPNPNISTFRPLDQQFYDNKMYNGIGYLPCNGYVPCQPEYLSEENKAERLDGAMPCHNHNGEGDTPAGCW